jgi:hypothetical protein
MFGGVLARAPRLGRARLDQSTSSVDAVAADVQGLEKSLDGRDRSRLDEYLSNVREVERAHHASRGAAHAAQT